MLTSIRGLSAATLSAGMLISAAPAFASEISEAPVADEEISAELVAASAALDITPADPSEVVLSTSTARAAETVEVDQTSSIGGETGFSFSANVALTSEYRFRGVDLSGGEIAIQGGFDLSHSSGFYAGTWASSLDEDTVGYGSTELDLYAGWGGDLSDAISADVGVIAYTYPDAVAGDFDYYEFYGSLGFSLGPVSATTGVAYAPDQDSLGSTDNLYIYTDLGIGISGTPLTLNGHVGYTDGFLTFTNDSKAFDWSISADVALGGNFSANIAYVGAEGDIAPGSYDFVDDAVVATISASF